MKLWVDADACPGPVRDILVRASQRLQIPAVFVANKNLSFPGSGLVSSVRVGIGQDKADQYIVKHAQSGDLAVTQDIPLAGLLVPKGVVVIDPRGELFTEENVSERLSVRDFMQELRESGVQTGGPSGYSEHDRRQFAAALDRQLTRLNKRRP